MVEFVLEQNVHWSLTQPSQPGPGKIIAKVPPVVTPWERKNLHLIAPASEVGDQHAIVQVPTGDGVEAAVDN